MDKDINTLFILTYLNTIGVILTAIAVVHLYTKCCRRCPLYPSCLFRKNEDVAEQSRESPVIYFNSDSDPEYLSALALSIRQSEVRYHDLDTVSERDQCSDSCVVEVHSEPGRAAGEDKKEDLLAPLRTSKEEINSLL